MKERTQVTRVLYLTPGCFDKGGISRYSRYQITALRYICGPENVRVLSLLGVDKNAIEMPFEVYWHSTAVPGHVFLHHRMMLATQLIFLAQSWRPDVIHSAHVNFGPLVEKAALIARAQTTLNVYGLEIWSGLCQRRRKAMARVSRIISDCHFTARYVVDSCLHREMPTVIWDPVDLARFRPGPADIAICQKYNIPDPGRHTIIMSLGRLSKDAVHKGFDRLIEAIASIAVEAPEARLVIAGSGGDRPRLEALVQQRGIGAKVFFTGPVDEADLPAVYRCAHIFSLVSDRGHDRGEGIPLTPLEAMACGKPIIVGNEDGSREAVIDSRNGFIVSPRSQSEHREALRRLLHDRELQSNMGHQARQVAEQYFSFERFVEEHRAFIQSLKPNGQTPNQA